MNRSLLHTAALAGLLVAAASAHADCAPVIAAYAKAQSTGRFALFDVTSMDGPAQGDPFQVTVGGNGYIFTGTKYKSIGGGVAGSEGEALRAREKSGAARCESIGAHSFGGEKAAGYRILDARAKALGDGAAIEFYVSSSTGLPAYHAMGTSPGWRWVYGTAVVAPSAGRIEK